MEAENIVIVGAGIAGLATALGLHRNGLRCLVLESADILRTSGFALTVWTNAWKALDALGVGDKLREKHDQLVGLEMISLNSDSAASQLDLKGKGKCGQHEVRCVRRNQLVEALAEEVPEGTIRFSAKVDSIEEAGKLKVLHLVDGSTIKAKVLIGCDGINSIVAKWMGFKVPTFTGRYATRGFAAYPQGHGFNSEFLQYFGTGFRSGMLPCDEKNIYWFFTWTPASDDKMDINDVNKVRQLVVSKMRSTNVREYLSEVVEKSEMSTLASSPLRFISPFELLRNDICKQNVCVAGDAFHSMTPDLGQGGCSSLEDGLTLANCLTEALRAGQEAEKDSEHDKICTALKKYATKRRYRAFELVATSFLFGLIQENKHSIISFFRDWCLSSLLARKLLSVADFDCVKA